MQVKEGIGTGFIELAKSRHGGVPVRGSDSHEGCPYDSLFLIEHSIK